MQAELFADWQIWGTIRASRMPLELLLHPKRVQSRTQATEYSDSAYIFRMFDLFFGMRSPQIVEHLTRKEQEALGEFSAAYTALSWRPLIVHPHISELPDEDFSSVIPAAKSLDKLIALRVGRGPVSMCYWVIHGWPLRIPKVPTEKGFKG